MKSLIYAVSLFWVAFASAQDAAEPILTGAFAFPGGFAAPKDGASDGLIVLNTELKPLTEWNGEKLVDHAYDARPLLKSEGVTWPVGASAIYFADSRTLVVKNTAKNMEVYQALFEAGCQLEPLVLRNELVLVSFKGSDQDSTNEIPSYEVLRKEAGASWHELARLEILSRSGMRGTGGLKLGGGARKDGEPGEGGATDCEAEIEVVVGPDGSALDARVSFRFQGTIDGSSVPLDISFNGDTALWTGKPQILQIYRSTPTAATYALVFRSTVSWPDRTPVKVEN